MILQTETARTVKVALAKTGMTHKALAAHLKVSRLTLWRILTGQRAVRARERRLIAMALGMRPGEIFQARRVRRPGGRSL